MDIAAQNPLAHITEFEFHDFIEDPNFDQFVNLIRGESEDPAAGFDFDFTNACLFDNQFCPGPGDGFQFHVSNTLVSDPGCAVAHALPGFDGQLKFGEEDNDEEDSSATTTTVTNGTTRTSMSARKNKADRSRTLISERRRRGRMKEKLYALRSLVPNITKMDKASIVGDAVLYVQELQMQAKKLKVEIAGLESSLIGAERYQESMENAKKIQAARNNYPVCKKIFQMDLFQVHEGEFYVRLVCNKGEGIAASLYKALESLTSFHVQNSNLVTTTDKFLLAFTLNVNDCEQGLNLPNLKLWVSGALLNQGFEFITPLST